MLNPGRTLIICTCHDDGSYSTTYANSLDDKIPYTVTVRLGSNSYPVAIGYNDLPQVGETRIYPMRWTEIEKD